jgi:hypothetical protein
MAMTKKIISVVLLSLGSLSIIGYLLHAVEIAFLGEYPNFSNLIWRNLAGLCLLWGGAKLWQRWRLPLGIVSIVVSLPLQLGKLAFWSYRKGYLAFSNQSDIKPELLSVVTVGVIGFVIGIVLIYWQTHRDRKEKKSKTVS